MASLMIAYIMVGEQITAEQLIEKRIVMRISRHNHEYRHHVRVMNVQIQKIQDKSLILT